MSRVAPLPFQEEHIEALLGRFRALKQRYDALGSKPKASQWDLLRKASACVMLQAPTGIGKTLMASEVLSRFSTEERVLWFWFAPFAGVIAQTKASLKVQTPNLVHLDIESDRKAVQLEPGAIFVLTWQTVASKTKEARLARQSGDPGLSIDDLVEVARQDGYRIGVVVDEAHHSFVKASESIRFFSKVLQPDYVLMMTATPKDSDVAAFSKQTEYTVGDSSEWATVPRQQGVDAELLKVSVKTVRFLTSNNNDAQLLAFEEVAMAECAVMHRHLKKALKDEGIDLVPLMLVQVPNGGAAIGNAVKYLVEEVGFSKDAVKQHSSSEPDPNLMAMARDPKVEVIVFKMAIATGFDAPRAFTLAALRGARDSSFGVQVVGRIMRVHKLLQGRMKVLPPLLRYGYVFLANSADQEGLRSAADQINKVSAHLADTDVSTMVTFFEDGPQVQVVKEGQSLSLIPASTSSDDNLPQDQEESGSSGASTSSGGTVPKTQPPLFEGLTEGAAAGTASAFTRGFSTDSKLVRALELDAEPQVHRYLRKSQVPAELFSERLPKAPEDIEARLVSFIDFAPVLGDRFRKKTKLVKRTEDVFSGDEPDDADSWQKVSPELIAQKARQIAFAFDDTDRRELLRALKERFKESLTNQGHDVPGDEEELTRQLELVLVRNDHLIKTAYKRLRAEQVVMTKVQLPGAYETEVPWPPAKRNSHGVVPDGLDEDEHDFIELLDTEPQVDWWYRNLPGKDRTDNVGLYSWSGGTGFFPDFVVKVQGRTEGEGIVLVEVKGPHLRNDPREKVKAAAVHPKYGRSMMVSRNDKKSPFRFYRLVQPAEGEAQLVDDGPFEVQRLRHS